MKHLTLIHEDGSSSAMPVNDMSTLAVKTWSPPGFNELGALAGMPVLVEEQTFALKGVVEVALRDEVPTGATIVASEPEPTELSEAEASQLEAEAVVGVAPMPWEDES